MSRSVDVELVNRAWELSRERKGQQYIADILGVSLRQTQRYLAPQWLAERGLEHLTQVDQPEELKPDPLNPIEHRAVIDKIETHWENVLAILNDLQGVGVFDPNAREIRLWISRPHEPSWPAPKGRLHRSPDGSISMKLLAEDRPEWAYVTQHLAGHPLFNTIKGWKLATAKDVAGRRSLFEWLLGQVTAELGLSVSLDDSSDNAGQPWLTCFYADHLYDQIFRRVSGLPAYSVEPDQLRVTSEVNVKLYDEPLFVGHDKEHRDRAIRLLIDGPNKLSETPVAKATGQAYRHADKTTQELKSTLARFLHVSGRIPDTRCEVCTPWFEELGLANEGS